MKIACLERKLLSDLCLTIEECEMDLVQFPKEIMIEATNYCNNKCFFCASPVSNRKKGFINKDKAIHLINESYELGCRVISFHGMGEPFLCNDLHTFVEEAKRVGFEYIYLDSNGTIAGKGRVESVLEAGLDSLKFSIHAASPETFYKITNNDSYNNVLKNAKYVSQYIKEHGLKCKTIAYFALSRINEKEEEAFKQIYETIFSDVWIKPIHNGSGVKLDNVEFSVKKNEFSAMNDFPCKEIYNRIIINWEGKAIACSTDWTGSLVYGDTNNESLSEIWNNSKIRMIREMHNNIETLPKVCASCMGVKGNI